MIVIVQRFAFRDGVPEDERDEVVAAMRRTAGVGSVAFRTVGRDIGDPAEGFTHAYLAGITDLDALREYFYDPVHLAGDHYILPRLARLSSVRFTDDPDPDLTARIEALFREKVAAHPEWGVLLDAIPDVHLG